MIKTAMAASAAIAALAAASGPAMAQSNRDTHFDGPYVSGTVGIAVQTNDRGETIVFDTNRDGRFDQNVNTTTGANAFSPGFCNGFANGTSPLNGCVDDKDRVEYSGRIGYDRRALNGDFVGGILLEVSRNNSRDRVSAFSTTPARYTIERRLDWGVALRGRLGYTPGGGALFYVTGGPSYAKLEHNFYTSNTANAFAERNDDKWVFGGQVGGGTEIMLTDNVSLGLEYLFNKYRDRKYRVEVTQGTAAATNPFLLNGGGTFMRASDRSFEFHSLRASLSYQF